MRVVFDDWQETPRHKIKEPRTNDARSSSNVSVSMPWSEEKYIYEPSSGTRDKFKIFAAMPIAIYLILFIISILSSLLLLRSSLSFLAPIIFVGALGFAMTFIGNIMELSRSSRKK